MRISLFFKFLLIPLISYNWSDDRILILEFNEDHSKQSSIKYDNGKEEWFTYNIDRVPYKVLFKKKSEKTFKPKANDLKKLKDYKWLNENYGWSDNIKFLKGSYDFAKRYDKIFLLIKNENCLLEVSLIIEMEE